MTKNIALIDWDGTIRKGFTIISWVKYLIVNFNEKSDSLQKIIEKFNDYDNGALSHDELANATAHIYATYLEGRSAEKVEKIADEFVSLDKDNLFSFYTGLFDILREYNIRPIIISGCPIEVLNSYKKHVGFKNIYGLRVNIVDRIYTSNIIINPGVSTRKEEIVKQEILQKNDLALVSLGNSTSDMPLFNNSKLSFIVNNKNISIPSYNVSIKDNDKALLLFEKKIKEMV